MPVLSPRRAREDAAQQAAHDLTAQIRERAMERARERCEAPGCGLPAAEMDHFWGRAKAPENIETVWMLCGECHRRKTKSQPTRRLWISDFGWHCRKHGYVRQEMACQAAEALERAQHPKEGACGE